MKTLTIITMTLLLVACDYGREPEQKTGKEEAGQVAISCIQQMGACEDWKPVEMADLTRLVDLETCKEWDMGSESSNSFDFDERNNCRDRNIQRETRNHEILALPKQQSPCQQQIDSCVHMVEALVGAPTTIHHHEKR